MNVTSTVAPAQSNEEIFTALATFDKPAIRQYQKDNKSPNLDHLPGDKGMPVIGHTYWFLNNIHKWINNQHQQYGSVFTMHTPLLRAVLLLGPEVNRLVFQNENKIFSNFLAWDTTFNTLFDNNLLERDFKDHKTQRKILQQAFKRPAIEGHMELMNPLLEQGINQWRHNRPIKAMNHIKDLLLNVGAEVFLGINIGKESAILNQAFTDIVAATADPLRRREIWFSPYAKGVRGNKVLTRYIMNAIPERRRNPGRDLFSQLCQLRDDEGKLLSDEVVRDHIIFLLFAAHDTTTSALSALLYSLATDLQWQETLREEMFSINKTALEFNDIEKLEKTGWSFKEALRMYPALTLMPRYALEEFEFNGHRIKKNAIVAVSSLFTHYMPEYWTQPHRFDPLRFSPERAEEKRDFFQYIPFGGGAHKCLGMHFAEVQGKMFLFHLLKNYRITKNPKMKKYRYNNIPLTFPTDGLPLSLQRL